MRQYLLNIVIATSIIISSPVFSQIKVIKTLRKESEAERPSPTYDSLSNFLPPNLIQSYRGQKFIILPRRSNIIGFDGFYRKLTPKTVYAPDFPNNKVSKYDSLALREFIIDSVITCPLKYLVLRDSAEIIYYQYPEKATSPIFVIEGYIKKLEYNYKNQSFIYSGQKKTGVDPFTGKSQEFIPGQKYIFESIFAYEDSKLHILFRNSSGGHIMEYLTEFNVPLYLSEKDYKKLVAKYGSYWVNLAVKNNIQVGMPVQLVEFAWGKPISINKSSYGSEQWCYYRSYVYIEKGKVTAWQNMH